MKNWKIDRIISVATLLVAFTALILVLKRQGPASPQQAVNPASVAGTHANAMTQTTAAPTSQNTVSSAVPNLVAPSPTNSSSASPVTVTQQASPKGDSSSRVSSDVLNSAIAQASGALSGQLSPGTDLGSMPPIKDQQVSFDGDVVHGRFLTTIAGKDVWITISGHLGEKDGYATFDPTEFKVGDIDVPVSLVNGPLQKQLAEQRDKMKLPD